MGYIWLTVSRNPICINDRVKYKTAKQHNEWLSCAITSAADLSTKQTEVRMLLASLAEAEQRAEVATAEEEPGINQREKPITATLATWQSSSYNL